MSLIRDIMTCSVNARATPGIPLCSLASNNAKLFAEHGPFVLNCVKQRLLMLARTPVEVLQMLSAKDRVIYGFCDPIRVFVKNEPHGKDKIASKRFRLICAISIIDQIVERILHTSQNQAEIDTWWTIPSKPGGSMTNDADVKKFAEEIFKQKDLVDVDISGFDWSVQGWELFLDANVRIMLARNPTEHWIRAVQNRTACLARSMFVFADGDCVMQLEDALQKSGSFNTASTNSRIKIALSMLVGAEYATAYGDDGLETRVENGPALYLKYGHPVKSYNPCPPGEVTFCSSRIFVDGTWEPITWSKTLYRFLCQKVKSWELLTQFRYTLRRSPHIGRIEDFLHSTGVVLGENFDEWEEEENWPEEGHQESS